jgi:hypothetical protein
MRALRLIERRLAGISRAPQLAGSFQLSFGKLQTRREFLDPRHILIRLDHGKCVALLDNIAFALQHIGDAAGNLRPHPCISDGLDRAGRVDSFDGSAAVRRRDDDRNWPESLEIDEDESKENRSGNTARPDHTLVQNASAGGPDCSGRLACIRR